MTDERARPADAPAERDDEQNRRGGRAASETTDEPPMEFGITDEDLAQIESYLQKQAHVRTVDDLRPSSKQ